jgi:serine phosphatase RsbU (regulator of sigma subunit)
MYDTTEGYYIISVLPTSEAIFSRNLAVCVSMFMEVIVFAILFALIYFLIKILVVDNIRKINQSLSQITNGNLNVTVDVRTNKEFASLSDDINQTVVSLKGYIAEAAARIDKELEFSKSIQHSALPNVFPPYPNRKDFDIFASMNTAKEVGGDFYDFCFVGEDRFAFVIADVSGKGIPASLFMMTAKTMIKSFAETGAEVNDVFTCANEKLYENNETGMFVTAWMGIIDLKTGFMTFANAGHNPPLLKQGNGEFTYLKSKAGFVLAGMGGMKYCKNELQLNPGDVIYLYTDGVTEATDSNNQLYGEDRLQNVLNLNKSSDVASLCKVVKYDVDAFVDDAPQFDDITMLALRYNGSSEEQSDK